MGLENDLSCDLTRLNKICAIFVRDRVYRSKRNSRLLKFDLRRIHLGFIRKKITKKMSNYFLDCSPYVDSHN